MGSTVGSAKNESNCFFSGLHIEVTKTKENLSPKHEHHKQEKDKLESNEA